MILFHNDRFLPEEECRITPTDRGLTLGDGVFDTMLAVDGAPQDATAHFGRLTQNAAVLNINFSLDFEATAQELLKQNGFEKGRFAIRTTVTRGAGARGLVPPENPVSTIIMRVSPAPEKAAEPIKTIIAQSVRRNDCSPLSRVKSLNYGDNLLALMEAKRRGADDAILLNTKGDVCCASAANLFIIEGENFITPPLQDGVLDGITRGNLIRSENAREESITPTRLLNADSVFLTNSIQGIRMVWQIGDTSFPDIISLDMAAA